MSEKQRSEDLWMRFLDGNVSEEENERLMRLMAEDDALLKEYLAVSESQKRIDSQPLVSPNQELAQKQIRGVLKGSVVDKEKVKTLPYHTNFRKYLATAATAALLIGVALFFLFRPDHNDNNLAQQEKQRVESEAKTQSQSLETTTEQERSDMIRKSDIPSNKSTEDIQPEPTVAQEEIYSFQKLEKNYAAAQTANRLTVTKPSKDDYRVLCKNLEKNLLFEWSATNVQKLHFTVTDSKGKTIAETKDITANQASLKYGGIYPEQKLTWRLIVVFKDGTQDMRSGQVQIDYLSIEK